MPSHARSNVSQPKIPPHLSQLLLLNLVFYVSYLCCVPSYLLKHLQPTHWEAEWEYLDAMEGLLSNNQNIGVLSTFSVTFSKHHVVQKQHHDRLPWTKSMLKSYTIQYNLTKHHSVACYVICIYRDMSLIVYGSPL